MTASEWKAKARAAARKEAVELELPSGARILARRPDPLQFASWGRLPMGLVTAAGGERGGEIADSEVADLVALYRDVLIYCCVAPRITLDPRSEDEIHPRDIPREDWMAIVRWALRVEEARALEGFRGERGDVGAGGDSQDVRPAAVEPARD